MSSAQVAIKMTSDEAQAWAAFQKLARAATGFESGVEKISKKSRELAAEQKKLERAAKRVYDETRTPQERYNAKLKEMDVLVKRAGMSQDTYRRKVAQLKQEYLGVEKTGQGAFGTKSLAMVRTLAGALGAGSILYMAVSEIKGAYRSWVEEIERASQASKEFHATLIRNLSEAGDLARGKEIETFIENIPGVTRTHGEAAFSGIVGAAPGLSLARRKELTSAVARIGATGQDVGEFGRLTGDLAEELTEKTAQDLASMTLVMRQAVGDDIRRLIKPTFLKSTRILGRTGLLSTEETLGLGMAAIKEGITPEVLISMADVLTKPQELGKGRLAAAAPQERMKMLRESPEARREALGQMGLKLEAIFAREAEADFAGQLVRAQKDDAIAREIQALRMSGAGLQTVLDYEQLVKEEKKPQRKLSETLGRQKERYEKFVASAVEGMPWYERAGYKMKRMAGGVQYGLGLGMEGTYYENLAWELPGGLEWAMREEAMRKRAAGQKLSVGEQRRLGLRLPGASGPPALPPPPAPPQAAIEAGRRKAEAEAAAAEELKAAAGDVRRAHRNVGLGKPDQDR